MSDINQKLTAAKEAALSVVKSKGLDTPKVKVALVMDYSGSMSHLYTNGFVQEVIERIVPLAMAFTPEKSMPMYIFSDSCIRVLPDVTEDNVHDYITDNILRKYSYGSTQYAPAIRMLLNKVIKENGVTEEGEKKDTGLLGGLKSFFGGGPKKPDIPPTTGETPTLVIFITDGDNNYDDKSKATAAIVEAAKHSLFFQFVGLGHSKGESFPYLQKLDTMTGRFIDNANLLTLTEDNFKTLGNTQLYQMLLDEFPSWYKEAQIKGIFKVLEATT